MIDPDLLDYRVKPFYKPTELAALGFGNVRTIYQAIGRGEIPARRVGSKMLIPTPWVRMMMGIDEWKNNGG